ncbi:phosphotransferase [Alcanivorax sp.]|uniref:phosphotransferase n=1 Tax=Alcanivorax sp. TaxID=1872427 RepID=UPI0025B9B2A1|nr:phosphotransferase [Alcanivorax sp.]
MSDANVPTVTMKALLEQRQPQLPAQLQCGEHQCEVRSLLRFFPGRRGVYRARLDGGEEVILKLYTRQPRARRELHDEAAVLRALKARGVAAPAIVARLEQGEEQGLVIEDLGQTSASAVLASLADADVAKLVNGLVAFTGQMHAAGALQEDIHLDNFVLHEGSWYVIDAGGVKLAERFSKTARLQNLALLLAQFPPLTLPSPEQIVAAYQQGVTVPELVAIVRQAREKRLKRLVKKSLRDCTEFATLERHGLNGMARRADAPMVEAMLDTGLDALLDSSELLKDGNSATVGRVRFQGETLVIKRYNVKSAIKRIGRQFRSRARNSWMNAAYLGLVNVATPQAVCYLSSRKGGLKDREYLVCRNVSGEMLPEMCEQGGETRLSALRQMADFFVTMALMRFSHGDSKYTNFIFQEGGLQVLDLDGMVRHPGASLEADLAGQRQRLFRSWKPREALAPAAEECFLGFYHERKATVESWL